MEGERSEKGTMKFYALFLVLALSSPLIADPVQPRTREAIKLIQETLRQKGYAPGPVDGVFGPRSIKALKQFQKDKKLRVTGKIDVETARQLQAAGPPSAPTNLRVVEIKVE